MNTAVILAGGIGSRVQSVDRPKQFIEVYGKPLIIYTLETFEVNDDIDQIVVVCNGEWIEDLTIWIRKYDITKVRYIIKGGKTRQESSYEALKLLEGMCEDEDVVVIHDAARPLISNKIITDNVKMAKKYESVDTVISATDTIVKSIEGQCIDNIPNRKSLYMGQTPQSFKYSCIKKAHEKAVEDELQDSTDDCRLVLRCDKKVALVQGDKLNFKITTMEDLMMFKALLKMGKLEVN